MKSIKKYQSFCLILFLISLTVSCFKSYKKDNFYLREHSSTPVALIVVAEINSQNSAIKFSRPVGIAIDMDDNIYISDYGNDRIVKFNKELKFQREVGGGGRQAGLLLGPTFLTLDNDLNLYVSEGGNQRISRFDSHLNFVDFIDLLGFEESLDYGTPSGVAIGDYGETWITDKERNRIVVFDYIGKFEKFVGGFGYSGGRLNSPEKIIVDNDLNFYVADRKGNRIVIYDEFGTYLRDIKPNLLYQPLAMAFQNENLWILHTADRQIVVTDLEGNLINQFGPLLSGSEVPLVSPTDLSFNSDGQLLIVDPRSNRVIICDVIYDDEEQEKKN